MKVKKDIRTQIAIVFFVLFMVVVTILTFQNSKGYTTSYFGMRGNVTLGIKVKEEIKEIIVYDPSGNVVQQTILKEDQTTIQLPRTTYESQTIDEKTLYFQGWIKEGVVSKVYGPNETVEVSGGEIFIPYYAEDPDYSGFTFTIDEETGEYILAGADSSMTSAEIPTLKEGQIVSVVGKGGFINYSLLQTVTLPQTITKIDDYAFSSCSSLTSITIPDSVTSIGKYTFSYCSSLTSINVDENNTTYKSIDGVVFSKDEKTLILCPEGKSGDYLIPNGVTNIGENAFYQCPLTSVVIPDSVTIIDEYAFYYCRSLTSITLGNSVTSIGANAFRNCSSLTSITIPNSVTIIGKNAFFGCHYLTSITFENTTGWHLNSVTGASIDVSDSTTNAANAINSNSAIDSWYNKNLYRV